jgi:Fibronectin type III domain
MSHRISIAGGFGKQTPEQLVMTAGAVISGLTNNPAFPSPTVDLNAVQAAADDLKAAVAAQVHGGTAATAEKNNKQEALIKILFKLKHYVEDNCENDLALLLSSGFQAAAATRDRSPLANPSILGIDRGNSDELMLKVTPIARAKCYEVRSAVAGNGNVAGAWQQAGLFTSSRITIANLVPTTTYVFQVRAIGAAGNTEWSDPVSHMCA